MLCARGTGFVATLLQTTQFWCPWGTAHKDNFLYCSLSHRLLEWQNIMHLYFSNFLEAWIPSWSSPGGRATKGRSPQTQSCNRHSSSFGEGLAPWPQNMIQSHDPSKCLQIHSKSLQNLVYVTLIWCYNQRRMMASHRRSKNKLFLLFFHWWSHSLQQNSSKNFFSSLSRKIINKKGSARKSWKKRKRSFQLVDAP